MWCQLNSMIDLHAMCNLMLTLWTLISFILAIISLVTLFCRIDLRLCWGFRRSSVDSEKVGSNWTVHKHDNVQHLLCLQKSTSGYFWFDNWRVLERILDGSKLIRIKRRTDVEFFHIMRIFYFYIVSISSMILSQNDSSWDGVSKDSMKNGT